MRAAHVEAPSTAAARARGVAAALSHLPARTFASRQQLAMACTPTPREELLQEIVGRTRWRPEPKLAAEIASELPEVADNVK